MSADSRAIHLPVSGEPVSETMPMSGCRTIAAPVGSPCPPTKFATPGGKISAQSSASTVSVDIGVVSAGFKTSVLPAARAGAIFQIAIIIG